MNKQALIDAKKSGFDIDCMFFINCYIPDLKNIERPIGWLESELEEGQRNTIVEEIKGYGIDYFLDTYDEFNEQLNLNMDNNLQFEIIDFNNSQANRELMLSIKGKRIFDEERDKDLFNFPKNIFDKKLLDELDENHISLKEPKRQIQENLIKTVEYNMEKFCDLFNSQHFSATFDNITVNNYVDDEDEESSNRVHEYIPTTERWTNPTEKGSITVYYKMSTKLR